jgi:DNA-binding response OmpR family regulator
MDQIKALLIDDEEELVTTLVERLDYRGIKSDYALDGYEALAKMRDGGYNVVVLDLKLPGMGGAEVLKHIIDEYPDVRVLLITGHGSAANDIEGKPEGAYAYLIKPVNLEELIAKMREAVAGR